MWPRSTGRPSISIAMPAPRCLLGKLHNRNYLDFGVFDVLVPGSDNQRNENLR